jgi:hypothetical protein
VDTDLTTASRDVRPTAMLTPCAVKTVRALHILKMVNTTMSVKCLVA